MTRRILLTLSNEMAALLEAQRGPLSPQAYLQYLIYQDSRPKPPAEPATMPVLHREKEKLSFD